MESQKLLLFLASMMGFLAVASGSFGAHALKGKLSMDMLNTFEVGVRYMIYHALAIFAAVSFGSHLAAWFFLIGIVIFSGSLFALALTHIKLFGAITPIGGLLFLAGWLTLAISLINTN